MSVFALGLRGWEVVVATSLELAMEGMRMSLLSKRNVR